MADSIPAKPMFCTPPHTRVKVCEIFKPYPRPPQSTRVPCPAYAPALSVLRLSTCIRECVPPSSPSPPPPSVRGGVQTPSVRLCAPPRPSLASALPRIIACAGRRAHTFDVTGGVPGDGFRERDQRLRHRSVTSVHSRGMTDGWDRGRDGGRGAGLEKGGGGGRWGTWTSRRTGTTRPVGDETATDMST
jgi:hypothetical protein